MSAPYVPNLNPPRPANIGRAETLWGHGSPEGVQDGSPGNTYEDVDSGNFYVKRTGTGNTGWALQVGGGGSSAWADITGKPTTVAGFGITDAVITDPTAQALQTIAGPLRIAPTWNASGTSFQAFTIRATDTASQFLSYLIDARLVGDVDPKFSVDKSGNLIALTSVQTTGYIACPTGAMDVAGLHILKNSTTDGFDYSFGIGATVTPTWNSGATVFTALSVNATDTASSAASLIADFRLDGLSKVNITKSGSVTFSSNGAGTANDGQLLWNDGGGNPFASIFTQQVNNKLVFAAAHQISITAGTDGQGYGAIQLGYIEDPPFGDDFYSPYVYIPANGNATVGDPYRRSGKFYFRTAYWTGSASSNSVVFAVAEPTSATGDVQLDFYAVNAGDIPQHLDATKKVLSLGNTAFSIGGNGVAGISATTANFTITYPAGGNMLFGDSNSIYLNDFNGNNRFYADGGQTVLQDNNGGSFLIRDTSATTTSIINPDSGEPVAVFGDDYKSAFYGTLVLQSGVNYGTTDIIAATFGQDPDGDFDSLPARLRFTVSTGWGFDTGVNDNWMNFVAGNMTAGNYFVGVPGSATQGATEDVVISGTTLHFIGGIYTGHTDP